MTCTPAPLASCWATSSWSNTSWCIDTWENSHVCTVDEIGTVWDVSSWLATVWCQDTWADRSTPPPPPPPAVRVEARRWPGPSIVIYDEQKQIEKAKRKYREEEEVIIL